MAQTIVNFLTQNTSGVLSISSRVFDYAIGSTEQTIYLHLMEDLRAAITADDDDTIAAIVNQLNNWSKLKESTLTNVTVNQTLTISDLRNPPTTKTWTTDNPVTTMNRGMAEAVDKIIRTLRSAGWDPTTTAAGASALTALATIKANASIYPLVQYVTDGINQANGAVLNTGVQDISGTSLQQMLMVDYVSRGNDMLFSEMSGLSDAINLNQTALSYLNSLQDLMNQKDPQAFLLALDKISGVYSGGMSASKYSEFEKASFDQELGTTAKFTEAQIQSYLLSLNPEYQSVLASITSLTAEIPTLQAAVENWNSAIISDQSAIDLHTSQIAATITGLYQDANTFVSLMNRVKTAADAMKSIVESHPNWFMEGVADYWLSEYNNFAAAVAPLATELSSVNTTYAAYLADPSDDSRAALHTALSNFITYENSCRTAVYNFRLYATWGIGMNRNYDLFPNFSDFPQEFRDAYDGIMVNNNDDETRLSNIPMSLDVWNLYQGYLTNAQQALSTHQALLTATEASLTTKQQQLAAAQSSLTNWGGSAAGAFVNLDATTKTFDSQLSRIKNNLSYLITNLDATSGATSLRTSLQSVLDDFNGISEIKTWVQDYSSANQGSYQTHLNNSIVASQALNDAKREDLRRVMFIFEEFYKSATSMLSRLTQLIERMASSINR